jgi:NAD(P)-dependent dehydrogenase (short-subunit alcohol dehydrogenase family)
MISVATHPVTGSRVRRGDVRPLGHDGGECWRHRDGVAQTLEEVEDREWASVVDTNLGGVWRSFKYAAPALRRAGGGAMTSTGSMSGVIIMGGARLGAYTASKYGIVGLTSYFASELIDDNIRVNCVCPGRMITNIDESFGFSPSELVRARADRRRRTSSKHRRFVAEPREVAMVHLFLCSNESSFISGQAISANGGESLFLALDWTARGGADEPVL